MARPHLCQIAHMPAVAQRDENRGEGRSPEIRPVGEPPIRIFAHSCARGGASRRAELQPRTRGLVGVVRLVQMRA
jgi:hypothetical protein